MLPPRIGAALLVATCLAFAGCQRDQPAEPAPSHVEAFPDPPHVDGPLTVELRAALPLMNGDRRCRPAPGSGLLCSSDGSGGYRALGNSGPVVVDEVTTRLSSDHTSWGTTVRFAAVGGVVVVTIAGGVATVVDPADLGKRRASPLGLEKAEAWAVVDAFARGQTRSKQGM